MSSVLFSLFSSSSGGGGSSCRNIHSHKNSENASLSHLVVRGPGDDLLQNVGIHIWQGDNFLVLCVNIQFHPIYKNRHHIIIAYIVVHAKILQHGLDGDRLLCNLKQYSICVADFWPQKLCKLKEYQLSESPRRRQERPRCR